MILLTGKSLGERQKDLNDKVNEAAKNNVCLDDFKIEKNGADVEVLFKIDLAAKYRNIDSILKIFKTSDSLYVSRAVKKCRWLGDSEFALIINASYLHDNIFPHMSMKMKNKLLYSLSTYVLDDNRTVAFYEYCMHMKIYNAAIKFLLATPETYKQEVMSKESKAYKLVSKNQDTIRFFIGDSLFLAEIFLESIGNELSDKSVNCLLHTIRHLYSISGARYLDLLEHYICAESLLTQEHIRLGYRLSKEIMKTHKDRVLKSPHIYVNLLHKNILCKKSTADDAKVYGVTLLDRFWSAHFYENFKFIIDIIPANERFAYMKQIFSAKYPDQPFVTHINFYEYRLYELFNTKEREDWALKNIASGEELLGTGNDFLWYKFVNFEKAFEDIQKILLITTDKYNRRDLLNVLIDSAKDQDDLVKFLNCYYNRYVNEKKSFKKELLDNLVCRHNVYNFNEECWNALENIFYSLDVYNKREGDKNFIAVALVYYITRKNTVSEVLNHFIDSNEILHRVKGKCYYLDAETEDKIFQYFLQFYLAKFEVLSKETINNDTKKLNRYVDLTLHLLSAYSKQRDDIPELMETYINAKWDTFKRHTFFKHKIFTKVNLVKNMKTDAVKVINEFSKIKKHSSHTNWLIRKLKVYFHHDIAGRFSQLANDCLATDGKHYAIVKFAVYVIFYLADERFKEDFMEKHIPTSPKIKHATISQNHLSIQREICGLACFSRPPLPVKSVLRFVTGDYLQYCLPIFNYYLMNLPPLQCIEFVESLINTPVSIQKHGVRLAFRCFTAENLATLTNNIWEKTNNVYIRMVVYKALYNKVVEARGQVQLKLFDILKTLTLNLHEDDSAEVFELLTKDSIPYNLMGDHLVSAWEAVKVLPEKKVNLARMTDVITKIEHRWKMVPEEFHIAIIDEHVFEQLDKKAILNTRVSNKKKALYQAKWKLADRFLTHVYNREEMTRNLEVIKHITKRVIEMWNEVRDDRYILREFCSSFLIKDLEQKSYVHAEKSYSNVNIIFKTILKMLEESLPKHEIYFMVWQLRLSDIARKVMIAGKHEFRNVGEMLSEKRKCILAFAEAFGGLVKEYVRNKKYFASFADLLEPCVMNKLKIISDNNAIHFEPQELQVIMCSGLLKYKTPEIYMFIAVLLPKNFWDDSAADGLRPNSLINDHRRVLKFLKSFKNDEVRYFMYKKFVMTDYQFRENF